MSNLLSNGDNIKNNDACLCVFLCIRALTSSGYKASGEDEEDDISLRFWWPSLSFAF